MPVGLDGNPNPLRTVARDQVLEVVADRVMTAHHISATGNGRTIVAIDGQSGSGKSTFGDELAKRVEELGAHTIRSTTDSFHRPRAARMAAGSTSPTGYYEDSHQLDRILTELLEPFASGAISVHVGVFDEPSDGELIQPVDVPTESVLIFDGLFLQRDEFRDFWNVSVLIEAQRRSDEKWLGFLLGQLPDHPTERAAAIDERLKQARWPRYSEGWQLYLDRDNPAKHADIVVDNNDIAAPKIVT